MSIETMAEVSGSISLDFAQRVSPVIVFAKQGDAKTRIINIQPLMNGVPVAIDSTAGFVAKFAEQKPDGYVVYNDSAVINNDGTITVVLSDQSLVAHGKATCCIVLENSDEEKRLTSQNFTLFIEYSAGAYQNLVSTDEITSLEDKLEQIQAMIDLLGDEIRPLPEMSEDDAGKVLTVDASGTPTWRASSWNGLLDRPFYENVTDLGSVIEWDGTSSSEVVSLSSLQEGLELHRVSSATPTLTELRSGQATISFFDTPDGAFLQESLANIGAFNAYVYGMFSSNIQIPIIAVSLKDNITVNYSGVELYIPKKGIYLPKVLVPDEDAGDSFMGVVKVELSGYTFKEVDIVPLDPKYLSFCKTVIVADEEVKISWTDDFGPCGLFTTPFDLEPGKTYSIEINGEKYTGVAKSDQDGVICYLGNGGPLGGEQTDDPYAIACVNGGSLLIGFFTPSAMVKVYTDEYVQIPHECLSAPEVFDLSEVFDYSTSVALGGSICTVSYDCSKIMRSLKKGGATFKIRLGSTIGEKTVYAQIVQGGRYAKTTEFVNDLSGLFMLDTLIDSVNNEIRYSCNQVLSIPTISSSDNGKFLQVADGKLTLVDLQDVSTEGL